MGATANSNPRNPSCGHHRVCCTVSVLLKTEVGNTSLAASCDTLMWAPYLNQPCNQSPLSMSVPMSSKGPGYLPPPAARQQVPAGPLGPLVTAQLRPLLLGVRLLELLRWLLYILLLLY